MMDKPVLILTGKIGTGKTTACRKAVKKAVEKGLAAGGILTPPIYEDGTKTGFYAEDLGTGERWVLGSKDTDPGSPGTVFGMYRFLIGGFARAFGVLKTAIADRCGLIVLDEIGPLEIVHKKGFWRMLETLFDVKDSYLLLVVRPSLIEDVKKLLGDKRTVVFTLDKENRDTLPDTIAAALEA
jgi:nucleoside-triphosphatase THEP1